VPQLRPRVVIVALKRDKCKFDLRSNRILPALRLLDGVRLLSGNVKRAILLRFDNVSVDF
jgi:hypothetical protein